MLTPLFIVVAIAALGFLIVVHEGGHYFVARWCRMRIERFSIGFGPGVVKKVSKKTGTTFQLAPIPFGGFVEIRGMNIAEDVDPDDPYAYPNRPVWQRFLTIFAGPATNYLSAIVLAMALYTCHGVDVPHWYGVGRAMPDYDAYGKLEPGDRIIKVNGVPLYVDSGPSLTERINASNGAPIALTLERDGKPLEVSVKPKQEKDSAGKTMWRIGVAYEKQELVVGVGVVDAAQRALVYPIEQTKAIGRALYGIVFGSEKADPGGPIRMVEEFYRAFSAGIVPGINLLMMLSVYLGLFNLLPIPALDGGRLVFLVYEMVTRRRANPKIETMVHMAGIMALGVVMLVVLYIDLRRFWT
ncbi:MAG TPA: M50 family metallopeptidase [Kofleriaceae bacterium]